MLKTIYTCSCPFCSFIRCGSLWSPLCLPGHCKARPRGRGFLVGILPTIASVCVCMRVSIFFAYYSRSSCNLFNHLFTLSVNSRCLSPSLSQGLGDVSLYVHLVHCQAWTHSSLTLAEDSTDTWGKSVRELGSAFSWWRRISCYTSCMHACLSAACREIGNLGNGTP